MNKPHFLVQPLFCWPVSSWSTAAYVHLMSFYPVTLSFMLLSFSNIKCARCCEILFQNIFPAQQLISCRLKCTVSGYITAQVKHANTVDSQGRDCLVLVFNSLLKALVAQLPYQLSLLQYPGFVPLKSARRHCRHCVLCVLCTCARWMKLHNDKNNIHHDNVLWWVNDRDCVGCIVNIYLVLLIIRT